MYTDNDLNDQEKGANGVALPSNSCPATRVGQEMYKVVVIDTFVQLLGRLVATLSWYLW